uniref:F-box domain-containing protein n=1 Tax=Sus scrofa TaxID=9823 RepID=A0A287AB25_PIG
VGAAREATEGIELEAEEALGLNQLPSELLLMLLSHMPPRTLIRHCCPVCRRWHALVDCQVLWLIILAWDHHALWPILQTCLPPIEDTKPSILGRFCVCRPVGRNLMSSNPEECFLKPVVHGWEARAVEGNLEVMPRVHLQICFLWYHKEKQILDLQEEGLWPELLDSGKLEICVSDWWNGQQGTDDLYHLIVQLPDANLLWHPSMKVPLAKGPTSTFERKGHNGTHLFFCLQASHVFSSFKKGVHFVSLEHWVWNLSLSERYQVYLSNSSAIVRVRPSSLRPVFAKQPDPAF